MEGKNSHPRAKGEPAGGAPGIEGSAFAEAFREVEQPLAITDAVGLRLIAANPAFERLAGRDGAELAKLAADRLFEVRDGSWEDVGTADRPVRALLIQGDGNRAPVEIRARKLTTPGAGMLLSVRDERPGQWSEEAQRAIAQAQRTQALGQMASGIAHDFNNVLMAVLPWSDLLRRKYPDEATVEQATDHIRRAVHRARDVTRQLLDFAQPRPPQKEPVSLAALIRQQLKIMRPALPPEIEITFIEKDAGWVAGDAGQLGQTVLNLALNARDAMPSGGTLTLELRGATREEGERWRVEPAKTIVLRVSDTGRGIGSGDMESIFNPFFTTKELGRGPGLGLPVALTMVQQHGGAIYVDSEPGAGATFYILLSRLEAAADRPARLRGARAGMRVMVVDDEAAVLEALTAVLQSEGFEVMAFDRGERFLEAIAREAAQPDLVVLDLGIPGVSGDELHRRLRVRYPDVPVLISTGYGDPQRVDPLLSDPKTAFQQKPYDADALFATISRLLERR